MAMITISEAFKGKLGLALRELNGQYNPYKECKVNINEQYGNMSYTEAINAEKPTTVEVPYRKRGQVSKPDANGYIKGGEATYGRELWTLNENMSNLEEIPGYLLGNIPITEEAFQNDIVNMISIDIDTVIPKAVINTVCKTPKVNIIKVAPGSLTIKDFYVQLVKIKQSIRAKGYNLTNLRLWQGPDLEAAWSTAMFDKTMLPASASTNVLNGEVIGVDGIKIEHVNEEDLYTEYEHADVGGLTVFKPTVTAKKILAMIAPTDCILWDLQRVAPKVGTEDKRDIIFKGHDTHFGTLARTPFADAIYVFVEDETAGTSLYNGVVEQKEVVSEPTKKGALAGIV